MERTMSEQKTMAATSTQSAVPPSGSELIPNLKADDLEALLARAPLYNDWDEV